MGQALTAKALTALTLDDLGPCGPADPAEQMVALADLPASDSPELLGDQPTDEMVASVRRWGVLWPVTLVERTPARPNGNGRRVVPATYWVADGRRRIKAARQAGLERIRADVYPTGWAPPDLLALLANGHRGSNAASDLAAIERLLQQLGPLPEPQARHTICMATGLAPARLRARLRLRRLVPELRQALDGGTITTGQAERLAALPADAQEDLAALVRQQHHLTADQVREARRIDREARRRTQLELPVEPEEARRRLLELLQPASEYARSHAEELRGWSWQIDLMSHPLANPPRRRKRPGEAGQKEPTRG